MYKGVEDDEAVIVCAMGRRRRSGKLLETVFRKRMFVRRTLERGYVMRMHLALLDESLIPRTGRSNPFYGYLL